MRQKISGIYQIIDITNGKFYVGSSKDIIKRKNTHFQQLKNKCHGNQYLQRVSNIRGAACLIFLILEEGVPENELLIREQLYLDEMAKDKTQSMNLSFIAGRIEMTPDIRKKLSKTWKKKYKNGYKSPSIGKRLSDDTKRKLSEAHSGSKSHRFGKHLTKAAKKKLSKLKLGIPRPDITGRLNYFWGKKHTEETRKKMSIASRNRDWSYLFKPVHQIHPITNKIIKTYPSIVSAAKSLFPERQKLSGVKTDISAVCRHRPTHYTAYGFKWEYA